MGGAARVQPYRLGATGPVIPSFLSTGEQSDAVYRQLAARESAYGHRMSKTLVAIQSGRSMTWHSTKRSSRLVPQQQPEQI